jgi:hypothetical protein
VLVCGCVGVWVRGCVGAWVRGCAGVWVCGCVSVWVCGCGWVGGTSNEKKCCLVRELLSFHNFHKSQKHFFRGGFSPLFTIFTFLKNLIILKMREHTCS